MKVAYVVSLFPKISETFILREMMALRSLGAEISVVSLKHRREPIEHPESASFAKGCFYAGSPARAATALLRRLVTQPAVTLGMLGRVIVSHASRPAILFRSLILIAVAAEVSDDLRARGVDRVHAHWATYPALVAWAVRRFEGIPYSVTAHAHDIFLPNPMLGEKIRESEFTVTISEFNRKWIEERCGPEVAARLRLLHCGVPLQEYEPRRKAPATPPRLVSIGRLVDYKGFPTLLRSVAALRAKGIDLRCDIVGEGPEESSVRKEIDALGLSGVVTLHGAKRQAEVREILSAATACVLSCEKGADGQMDGIPVVLMEAMALGVPVIATRISGIPELVIDGRTGLLAEPRDPVSLAAAIERLLGDQALADRLASAGRALIEEAFDIRKSATTLLALFERSGEPERAGRQERTEPGESAAGKAMRPWRSGRDGERL